MYNAEVKCVSFSEEGNTKAITLFIKQPMQKNAKL